MKHQPFFTSSLLAWNKLQNKRQMPWKGEKDPYKIWVSEIILQQTRVQQGLDYYNRFIRCFPDLKSLAIADEEKVYKLWEGLGYYTRCRNLITTAKYIHNNLSGIFPDQYEEIIALKGIGNYTASAIMSFAFNKPYAVLDGNVFRILSRFFGIEMPINTSEGKKYYSGLSQLLLNKKQPALYNQAIMDFGATVCKPVLPLCNACPLQKKCVAFIEDKVALLPVNHKIIKQRIRFFNYLVLQYQRDFYVAKRSNKDIWQNLYEFILIESQSVFNKNDLLKDQEYLSLFDGNQFEIKFESPTFSQKLTHQLIRGKFFHIEIKRPLLVKGKYIPVGENELQKLPFPKFIASYLTDKKMYL
jgi:A/G-specific adenine glycosylase